MHVFYGLSITTKIYGEVCRNCTAIVPLSGGGISRVFRCICAISAPSSEPPADIKCLFSASLPHTRPPFQREICKICSNCTNNCNIWGYKRTNSLSTTVVSHIVRILPSLVDFYCHPADCQQLSGDLKNPLVDYLSIGLVYGIYAPKVKPTVMI